MSAMTVEHSFAIKFIYLHCCYTLWLFLKSPISNIVSYQAPLDLIIGMKIVIPIIKSNVALSRLRVNKTGARINLLLNFDFFVWLLTQQTSSMTCNVWYHKPWALNKEKQGLVQIKHFEWQNWKRTNFIEFFENMKSISTANLRCT